MKSIPQKSLKNNLIKGAAGSFGLKIAATGLAFFTSVLLARLLGSEGLGIYSYIFSWVGLLSIPAILGLDYLLIREIAIAIAQENWGLMRGLLKWTNLIVFGVSSGLAIIAAFVFNWLSPEESYRIPFYIALFALPLNALGGLRGGAMKGLKKVVLGTIPEALVSPLLFLSLIGLSYWYWGQELSVTLVLIIKVMVSLVTFIVGTVWLRQLIPSPVSKAPAIYHRKLWLGSSVPLMLLGSMQLINAKADILMLGAIQGAEAVGIYVIVRYGAEFIIFIQGAANSVLAPNIASLSAQNKHQELQKIISQSSFFVFLISGFIGCILIVFSSQILNLFGTDFIRGKNALIILSIGQLVNTAMGPVGKLLTMTGYENYTAASVGASATINVVLNALLIPQWGINGAAIATAISIILVNIFNLVLVQKKLNITAGAWSIFFLKK